jgi:nucleotide-binding universal stress UspA family protein
VLSEGEPVDAILGRASGDDVDMIVMGTHGRTGLSRLFVGSVAEGVLRRASRPVVVVPYSVLVGREIEPAARAGA